MKQLPRIVADSEAEGLTPADAEALGLQLLAELMTSRRPPHEARFAAAGFADPANAAQRLRAWGEALRNAEESAALTAIIPDLIVTFATCEAPDTAFATLDEIVGRLPTGTALFTALAARPSLLRSLVGLIGQAPALARHLVVQPSLIVRMIDSSAYAPLPPDLENALRRLVDPEDRAGSQRRIAEAIDAHRFGLGLQLIEATADPIDISVAYCRLAEAGLKVMADDVLARMREVHGTVPGAELAILALGRFGGGALTSGSDLDMIYLFTGDYRAQSDGRKPLDANEYFSRVAQQITTALSTVTTLGPIYEVDTRLRPWGAKGLLACSTESFQRYHQDNAWTWEHMALTRARPVYGSAAARRELKQIVGEPLNRARDGAMLRADAIKMRGDIARHKPARGPFDIKLVDGGLIDLEFTVHVHQLERQAGIHPHLCQAIRAQAEAGLVDAGLSDAHRTLSRLLIALRLFAPKSGEPRAAQQMAIAQACRFDDWSALLAGYAAARHSIRSAWQDIAGRG